MLLSKHNLAIHTYLNGQWIENSWSRAHSSGKQLCRKWLRSPGGYQDKHESATCPCCLGGQQHSWLQEAKHHKQVERWSFPSTQDCWVHIWRTLLSHRLLSTREMGTYWKEYNRGLHRLLRDWNTSPIWRWEISSTEIFKTCLDMDLGTLLWVYLLEQRLGQMDLMPLLVSAILRLWFSCYDISEKRLAISNSSVKCSWCIITLNFQVPCSIFLLCKPCGTQFESHIGMQAYNWTMPVNGWTDYQVGNAAPNWGKF